MFIIKNKKFFFALSAILVALSIFSITYFGLNFGIDFKGGAITEIAYLQNENSSEPQVPVISELKIELEKLELGSFTIQETSGDLSNEELGGVILRTRDLTEPERQAVFSVLSQEGTFLTEQKRYNSIGPVIGEELKSKALWAILVVVIAIILFVAFAFRKVTEVAMEENKVSSWKYGFAAIVALIHDILIPTGIYAFLGSMFIDYQIDTIFIMAILAILGFSVNDTIVVFDRVRENLAHSNREDFDEIVGKSLSQTIARSINTSLTTLVVLGALYFFGGEATKQFALILSMGVIFGTYSSIFLASPLLTLFKKKA
ncbi:MAG: protein translocase subunit SecF [Candidatus Pacebacteria bacterium]|nr:protein translocase subunit SecF [Candidatus Paceibacterota bacterium]